MKKTLAIIIAALGCATANAQEINAVVARQSNAAQEMTRLTNTPNVILSQDGITLKNGDQDIKQYDFSDGNVTVLFASAINSTESTESLTHPVVIENGGLLTVSGTMANENAEDLVIEDGGQLRFDAGTVNAIVKKVITGYNDGKGNWYLVASPVSGATPTAVGMIDQTTPDNYDLYIFDQTKLHEEWQNNKVSEQEIESLAIQNGYLYVNNPGTTLAFNGQLIASADAKKKELVYDDKNAKWAGFNLVGNPYACNATIEGTGLRSNNFFFEMNQDGTALVVVENPVLAPCTAVFAVAAGSETTPTVSFVKEAIRGENNALQSIRIELLANGKNIDRAYVNMNGQTLPKFRLNDNSSEIFFSNANEELAVVSASATNGVIPVNFKAQQNGNYTIAINTENIDAEYMHLVDNMTGADIDLLATPNYSFEAKTSDYASRFKLVFGIKDENSETSENFAFMNNGNLVIDNIDGQATLQIIDVTGRVISTEIISGSYNKPLNVTPGLYILSLDDMTQKIIMK